MRQLDFGLLAPGEVAQELGERFRAERLAQNLTQQTLADRAGVTRPLIVRLEAGQPVTLPSFLSVLSALGRVGDLAPLLAPRPATSFDEAFAQSPVRKRGSL